MGFSDGIGHAMCLNGGTHVYVHVHVDSYAFGNSVVFYCSNHVQYMYSTCTHLLGGVEAFMCVCTRVYSGRNRY